MTPFFSETKTNAFFFFIVLQPCSSRSLLPSNFDNREKFTCPNIDNPHCTPDRTKRYRNACEAWKAYVKLSSTTKLYSDISILIFDGVKWSPNFLLEFP